MNLANRPKVGVAMFIWRGNKFLIGQRRDPHGTDTWSLPGGHLELAESWEAGAIRETLEETGVRVKNVRFLTVTNDIFVSGKHYVSIWMESDWDDGEPTVLEPDKLSGFQWVNFKSLPEPLFEPCWQNLRQAKPELFSR